MVRERQFDGVVKISQFEKKTIDFAITDNAVLMPAAKANEANYVIPVGDIDTLATRRANTAAENAKSVLRGELATERSERIAEDTNLQRQIDTKASNAALATETQARIAADSGLQRQIDTKASDADLATETQARIAADTNLQQQINAKASNAALAAEMQARIDNTIAAISVDFSQSPHSITIMKSNYAEITTTAEVASEFSDGLMPKESFSEIAALRNEVDSLTATAFVPLGMLSIDDETFAAMSDAERTQQVSDDTGRSSFNINNAVATTDNSTWIVSSIDPVAWIQWGTANMTVSPATNETLGIVQGDANTSGKVAVENDGTMSVVGWDELTELVDANETNINTKQPALNRTVTGNDDATATITDTGGSLSIPIPLTVVEPVASSTQTTPTANNAPRTLRAQLKILIDNIAYLFANKQNNLTAGANIAISGDTISSTNAIPATVVIGINNPRADINIPANSTASNTRAAINNAINALPATGGKIVLLEGTYNINGSILLTSKTGVTLEGMGAGTIINASSAIDYAIQVNSSSYCTVANLKVSGNCYGGILVDTSNNCTIANNILANAITRNAYCYGIRLIGSTLCTVNKNTCLNSSTNYLDCYGITLENDSSNCIVSENICNNIGTNINLCCGIFSSAPNSTISNNFIANTYQNGGGYCQGIWISQSGNTITGNVIKTVNTHNVPRSDMCRGIVLIGREHTVSGNIIANTCPNVSNASPPIDCCIGVRSDNLHNTTICGNTFTGLTTNSPQNSAVSFFWNGYSYNSFVNNNARNWTENGGRLLTNGGSGTSTTIGTFGTNNVMGFNVV